MSLNKISQDYLETIYENSPDLNGNTVNSDPVFPKCNQLHETQQKVNHYRGLLQNLKKKGRLLRSDREIISLSKRPPWFNEDLFRHARSVYERHFMGINFAHLSGLILLVRVDSIFKTLSATGESESVSKLFKRYYHTLRHVKTWYEGDIFEENSEAHRSFLVVRGMHNKVSSKFNASLELKPPIIQEQEVHLSEYDIMLTQFAFIGMIIMKPNNMGLIEDFSLRDKESFLHFWRTIGHYLGASEKFNLCSYMINDIEGLCETILEMEYKQSIIRNKLDDPQGIMSTNIVRSVKFIPMLTAYGMMRYLYELMGQETSEIDSQRNWYTNLSYKLIKLVMSNLLAYKPFRLFNNGLTRLSIFLVGKVEDWFSRLLETEYGHELRA